MNILQYLLEKYPNGDWEWEDMSENSNITMGFIEKYPNKPWDWEGISENSNITMEFIEKNLDTINFVTLSCNIFNYKKKKI
jgi:hypothetical protein